MRFWSRMRSALRNLFRKEAVEAELDDEVRAYVDLLTDERIAAGMSAQEARRMALAEMGGAEQVKQAVRDHRAGARLELLGQDVRYGLRQMRRNSGFTLTVVLTLALSIGANTAIFSVVNALMLTDLPYPHPERLGTIFTHVTGSSSWDERHHINGEQWELLRDQVPALLPGISGIRPSGVNLQSGTHVEFLHASRISAHYLDVLGIHPIFGRNFTGTEDLPHGPKAAILSYGLWRTMFGANAGIAGRVILIKGEPYTVVGVLPQGAETPQNADLYLPLQASRTGEGGGTNFIDIVRLRDGFTWQQADAEIDHAWAQRTNRYELEDNAGAQVSYHTVPLQRGETVTLRPQVMGLMLAAGFILLIACANLAGLTLVRVLRRTPEIATRLALGASRWQIERQLWIENILLAAAGGAAGIGIGLLAVRGLLRLLPEHLLPVKSVPLDGHVLAFTLLVSVLTSVLFGMLPALVTRRFDLRAAMGSRTATGGEHLRLRQTLIAGEVALTVVLLAASGLLIRTLIHLQTLPPGFDPSGVMTATASLNNLRYHDPVAFQKLLEESTEAMRRIPGVEKAAAGLSLPYERSLIMAGITFSGKETGQTAIADEVYVTPGYFDTLGIPILTGRAFTTADGPNTQHVIVINQAFARSYFHGANPVGQILNKDARIVGVVGDVAMAPGIDAVAPLTDEKTVYIPATQVQASLLAVVHDWFQPSWIVRTGGPVTGLTEQMQHALAGTDPDLPFSGFYSMRDLLAKTLAAQRSEVAMLSVLAALALLLSAVGIFALVANIVAQKTREIGLRMALGSTARQAMIHIGMPGVRASALGLVLGLMLCAGALRAMRSVLYGVGVYDLPILLVVVLALASVTLIAAMAPTLRIAAIDPATTLRDE
ncbi:ADOP family duplicated permease [Paracidobacterium acidisoli]|uniref:ABC transporter permease n=1 Tax=Paracidobacterium acidisoli TaxID=2303751 RepID=A0A372IVC5_9BACT|nr:ADOP family duplicated permease [Paracidobacterium acidisoli]MBT9329799.1 ABC transporter permease [Paracidobacterium acidisoli]